MIWACVRQHGADPLTLGANVDLTAAVGWLATLLGVSFAWPQALRAMRSSDLSGLSPLTQALMVVTSASWVAYGVSIPDPIMVFSNAVAGVAVVVTTVALVRSGHLARELLGGVVVAWAVVMTSLLFGIGGVAAGLLGAALGMAMTVPQAAALRRGQVPTGVSPATYALLAGTMSCWLLYGLLRDDLVIMAPNVVAVPIVVTVCVMLQRAQVDVVEPEVAAA